VILARSNEGKKQLKDLIAVIEARSLAEKDYAKALLKTCTTKEIEKLGTFEDSYNFFKEEAKKSHSAHDTVGNRLKDELVKPLQTFVDKCTKDKSNLDTKLAKSKKELSSQEGEYNKVCLVCLEPFTRTATHMVQYLSF